MPAPSPAAPTTAAPAPLAPAFVWPVRVYWEDTDAGGIVYHASYVRFMERARTEWLRARGAGQLQIQQQWGGLFVVSELALRYLVPARLDELLLVTAEPVQWGRASMTLRQRVLRAPDASAAHILPSVALADPDLAHAPLLCDAQVKVGWVGSPGLRPARIPDPVRTLLL